jgi:hypothetical protein
MAWRMLLSVGSPTVAGVDGRELPSTGTAGASVHFMPPFSVAARWDPCRPPSVVTPGRPYRHQYSAGPPLHARTSCFVAS